MVIRTRSVGVSEDEARNAVIGQTDARLANIGGPGRIIMRLDDPRGYYVAHALETFDREIRRASAAQKRQLAEVRVESWSEAWGLSYDKAEVRPDPPGAASLVLVGAERGSAILLLEPVGSAVHLLASQPLSAVLNAATLSGWVGAFAVWVGRRRLGNDRVRAEVGGDVAAEPNLETGAQDMRALAEANGDPSAFLGEPDVEVHLPGPRIDMNDGSVYLGHREIHLVKQAPDGTTTWVTLR